MGGSRSGGACSSEEICKYTEDAAKLEMNTRRLAPGRLPGFAASPEEILHFSHHFCDSGEVSG